MDGDTDLSDNSDSSDNSGGSNEALQSGTYGSNI